MAKNESLAVLHATLDFRRIVDVPGYDRISLRPGTRFIATMNYGYAGTRELNEALASRFMVIQMPIITPENLKKLLLAQHPTLQEKYADQLAQLFGEIRAKCESAEIWPAGGGVPGRERPLPRRRPGARHCEQEL